VRVGGDKSVRLGAWVGVLNWAAESDFEIGANLVLWLLIVDAPETLVVVKMSDGSRTIRSSDDGGLDGERILADDVSRETILVLPITRLNWIISIEPDGPAVTFGVASDFLHLRAAVSDLEISALSTIWLLGVVTPETVGEVDVSESSRTSSSGLGLDSGWVFADRSLWVGESSFVVTLSNWIISIKPFGPFITFIVAFEVFVSWAAPSDLEVSAVLGVLLVEAPETDLDVDVGVSSGTSAGWEGLDGSWVGADLELGLGLDGFPISSSGKRRVLVQPRSPLVALEHAVVITVSRSSPLGAAPLDFEVRAGIELVVHADESFTDGNSFHLIRRVGAVDALSDDASWSIANLVAGEGGKGFEVTKSIWIVSVEE